MAMNRQTKRMMQRQGQLAPDGTPARRAAQPRPAPPPGQGAHRPRRVRPRGPRRAAQGRLADPRRGHQLLDRRARRAVVLMALIFVLDYVFAKAVFFLFDT